MKRMEKWLKEIEFMNLLISPLNLYGMRRKTADAMFMGLGDVIFLGILVISAMTWLPDEVGFAGLHGPTAVAFEH